jgi:Mn-dependent DtxR family transcriptional regulator
MSQEQIYNLLKSNPDKFWTCKEIAEELGVSVNSVQAGCRKLRRRQDIFISQRHYWPPKYYAKLE